MNYKLYLSAICLLLFLACSTGAAADNVTDDATFFHALRLDESGLETVRAAVEALDWSKASAAYLAYRRGLPRDFWTAESSGNPAEADAILKGTIRNWAAPGKTLTMPDPNNFDWRANPLPPSDPGYSKEIPLATARTQFWLDLAAAYRKTHDEKYARFWAGNLADFVADNPVVLEAHPEREVAWRALEAGIRISDNWPEVYFAFLDSAAMTPELHTLFAKSVYEHGKRLEFTARKYPERGGNHVVSEDAGLMVAGTLFPEFQPSAEWRRMALARFAVEAERQVYPDGFQAELSPLYHAGVLHDFLTITRCARQSGEQIPEELESRVREMFRVLIFLQDGRGIAPALNDSPSVPVKEIAVLGLKAFDDPLLRFAAKGEKTAGLPAPSKLLDWSGIAVMRSGWEKDNVMGLFYAGPVPVGHWHQDKLQFLLWAYGQALLVDPGKMSYDQSPLRRYSIGTESHNTMTVDGKWQFRDATEGRKQATSAAEMAWLSTSWLDYSAGKYDEGYWACPYAPLPYRPFERTGPAESGVAHHRSVLFLKPIGFLVLDSVRGTGTHQCDIRFNVDAQRLEVDPVSREATAVFPGGVGLGIRAFGGVPPEVAVIHGQKDPPAGWIFEKKGPRPIFQIAYTRKAELPLGFATWLQPSSTDRPFDVQTTQPHEKDGIYTQVFRHAGEEWAVQVAPAGMSVPMHEETGDASWKALAEAVILHRTDQVVSTAIIGSSFENEVVSLSSDKSFSIEVKHHAQEVTVANAGVCAVSLKMTRPLAGEVRIEPGQQVAFAAPAYSPSPPTAAATTPVPEKQAAVPSKPGNFWDWLKSLFL